MSPSISDIDAYQAGSGAADFAIATANAARNFSCNLFKNYPGAIIPNVADDFIIGLWNGFCKNSSSGLPTEPESPFSGGQCPGHRYGVITSGNLTTANGTNFVSPEVACYGPIASIIQNTGVNNLGDCLWVSVQAYDFEGNPQTFHSAIGGGAPYSIADFQIVEITPLDGLPDTCGNPGKSFPPSTIPTADLTGTQTLDLPGGFSPSLQFTFPTPTADTNLPPQVSISASGTSLIPPFDITADLGGLHIGAGGNLTQTQLSQISAIDKNTSPPLKPTNPAITPNPRSPDDNAPTGLSNLAYVRITLTKLPSAGAIQAGQPPAPDVLFTGWFEYSLGEIPQGREPICFADQIFINDANFDGYSYTLTRYAEGYATEYYDNSGS